MYRIPNNQIFAEKLRCSWPHHKIGTWIRWEAVRRFDQVELPISHLPIGCRDRSQIIDHHVLSQTDGYTLEKAWKRQEIHAVQLRWVKKPLNKFWHLNLMLWITVAAFDYREIRKSVEQRGVMGVWVLQGLTYGTFTIALNDHVMHAIQFMQIVCWMRFHHPIRTPLVFECF